jgi:HlyD family secretion protein
MEPTNKSHLTSQAKAKQDDTAIEFLPDADAIERLPLPASVRSTVYVLSAALFCFVLWASFSQVEKIVVAQGRLITPLPNIVVQPLETSIIQNIEVRVGQVVRKGEVLASLDPTFAKADEAQLRVRLQSLDTQSQGLAGELKGQYSRYTGKDPDRKLQNELAAERSAHYEAQLAKMDQNLARLEAGIQTNLRDQEVLTLRLKSLLEMESMQESLMAQQFGARLHLLEAREKRLNGQREMDMAASKAHELMREKAALQAERMAFVKGWRQKTMEDLLSTSRERDGINEQLMKADKRKQLVSLVSPVDGVVLEIAKLSQGSVVQAAEKMFTLVPLGDVLEAEVSVDAVDIGYVKTGDRVHLKFDAFPFQKHGALEGKLRTLSEDAFKRDVMANSGNSASFYMGRIVLADVSYLRNMPEKTRLLPGMTLSAEIVVGKRSVMSYLLWPMMKAMDEAIREP